MSGNSSRSHAVSFAAVLFLALVAAQSYSQQTSEADPNFTGRLAAETERMQRQVRELSARVSALEASATTPSQPAEPGQSGVSAGSGSSRAAEQFRSRERTINTREYETIKATLGSIDYRVVQQRRRISSVEGVDAGQQNAAVDNLRKLADELQVLEDVVARLEIGSR